jgi:hypothetical protein
MVPAFTSSAAKSEVKAELDAKLKTAGA